MRQSAGILVSRAALVLGLTACVAAAQAQVFTSTLSGPAEFPANTSTATGNTRVTVDASAHTLRVEATFSGLSTNTSAAHIHCCVSPSAVPSTSGVATTTPSFVGFPLGVQAGSMDQTYSLLNAGSFSPAFVAANGGTAAGAEAAFIAGIRSGQAYLNIHTAMFPGGEIRGFLFAAPLGIPVPTLTQGLLGVLALLLAGGGLIAWRRRQRA